MKYKVIGKMARHIDPKPFLIEYGSLVVEFEDLPTGHAILEFTMNGIATLAKIENNKARITRSRLRQGIAQMRVIYVNDSGAVVKAIFCENCYISSLYGQIEEPYMAYPQLGDILARLAATETALEEAKTAYDSKVAELQEQMTDLQAALEEANTRLEAIQKTYDINTIINI